MTDCILYESLAQAQKAAEFAQSLGETEMVILFTTHDKDNRAVLSALKTRMTLKAGLLVKNAKDAMKHHQHYDILIGEATRELLESRLITHVYRAETAEEKDKTHRRGSGLNQVSAKLLKEKCYIYDLSLLWDHHQPLILGRMQQNKRIMDKYGCKQACWSCAKEHLGLRAPKERAHFLASL